MVLGSAVLHAGWNALVAGAKDTHATAVVAMLTGVAVFAIPAALTWRVEAQAWPFIAASAALELAYFALLAATYSRAAYSFAYPIARGSAPILVLLISVVALGADIAPLAILGILAVTGGVLLVRGVGTGHDQPAGHPVHRAGRRAAQGRPRHPPGDDRGAAATLDA